MNHIQNCRTAITRIEIAVVVLVVGLLVAVFFPAIEASREEARRMACRNKSETPSGPTVQHVLESPYGIWGALGTRSAAESGVEELLVE